MWVLSVLRTVFGLPFMAGWVSGWEAGQAMLGRRRSFAATKQAINEPRLLKISMLVYAIIYSPTTTVLISVLVSLPCCGSGACLNESDRYTRYSYR